MALYSGRILVRRGDEINYDPEKLMPGEWALSTDKKIVRICVSPGETIRMATYDAFEEDAEKIEEILATCQSIQEAVIRINTEISQKADAVAEYTAQAKNYSESALTSANNAHTSEINAKTSETNAKLSETNAKTSENLALGSKLIAENKSAEAEESANNAYTSALSASNSANSASKAAEAARESEQASSLNAQEAETFRDEAEQFRNEASLFTPDNYEELVQTATKTKERVDDLEENLETVSSDVDKTKEDLTELSSKVETNQGNIEKVSYKIDTVIEKADLRIKETASGENIHLADSADAKVVEFGLYGKATQSGEPTPDAPVEIEVAGSDGNVVVKSIGANLLNYDAWKNVNVSGANAIFENNGITITATGNDSHTSYTPSAFPEDAKILVNEGDIITLSWEESSNKNGIVFIFGCNESNIVGNVEINNNVAKSLSYTVPSNVDFITYRFGVATAGDTISYKNIMINKGSTPLPYEPYKETSSTIQTPNGLAGIPVDNGGNYTDANGQQWICDEIVKYADGSGEKIQWIGKVVFDGSEDEGWRLSGSNTSGKYRVATDSLKNIVKNNNSNGNIPNILCDNYVKISPNESYNSVYDEFMGITVSLSGEIFIYNKNYNTNDISLWKNHLSQNPITVYYELAEPIRTPLTAEQIAEIEKLCTFYSVTNICNDADCGMKVTYIVDAKRYIDNKIAELATAMVNNI